MRSILRVQFLLLGGFGLLLSYNNCSQPVGFSTHDASKNAVGGEVIKDLPDGSSVYSATLGFGNEATKPVDIVWIIDNSASMNQEADHVRSNVNNFMNMVEARADMKIALLSKAGSSGANVSLGRTGDRYFQINHTVQSNDSLRLLALALCPPGNAAGPACANRGNIGTLPSQYMGALGQFLRKDSKKVFVFVTDDNAKPNADWFQPILDEVMQGDSVSMFGFIGRSKAQSSCIASPGTEYVKLVERTDGETFNICDPDWTPMFSKLANNVVMMANRPFPVPDEVRQAQIISVKLNGVEIPDSLYRITREGLLIDSTLIPESRVATLEIHYDNPQ